MNLQLNKNFNFALVGHGYHLCYFFKRYKKKFNRSPIIITHKKQKHLKDIKSMHDPKIYQNLFKLPKAKIFELEDINSKKGVEILKKNNIKYIFSFFSRFIFKKKVINLVKKNIFNIHPSLLPEERGAGTFTNRILNRKFFVCATIHIINQQIDGGEILMNSKKKYINKGSLPLQFLEKTNICYKYLIDKFLKNLLLNKKSKLIKQNEKNKTYNSRYKTDLNGVIDWSLDGKSLESFIKAFSNPYDGAKSKIFFKKKILLVNFFNCKYVKKSISIHPFLCGRIFYQNKNIVKVYIKDGHLIIKLKDIKITPNINKIKKFEGKTFFNDYKDIILTNKIPVI